MGKYIYQVSTYKLTTSMKTLLFMLINKQLHFHPWMAYLPAHLPNFYVYGYGPLEHFLSHQIPDPIWNLDQQYTWHVIEVAIDNLLQRHMNNPCKPQSIITMLQGIIKPVCIAIQNCNFQVGHLVSAVNTLRLNPKDLGRIYHTSGPLLFTACKFPGSNSTIHSNKWRVGHA